MTGGKRDEKTASIRLSPPSTGRTYTMSAAVRPVGGRASTMLSVFTASTGPSDFTSSPVAGDRRGTAGRGGGGAGLGRRFGGRPPPPARHPVPGATSHADERDTHANAQ